MPHPVSDYGRSKLLAEDEARAYKDRLPVVIIRPPSVYGPRDTDVYELFRWASRGLTIEMTGGDRYLNLCYVEDLTAALLLSAEFGTESGSIYFVAEKRAYSWSEFRAVLLSTGRVKARAIKLPYGAAYLIGFAVRNRQACLPKDPRLRTGRRCGKLLSDIGCAMLTRSRMTSASGRSIPSRKGWN